MPHHRSDFSDFDCPPSDFDSDRIPSLWPDDHQSTLGVVIDPVSGRLCLSGDDSLGELDLEVRALW